VVAELVVELDAVDVVAAQRPEPAQHRLLKPLGPVGMATWSFAAAAGSSLR
jgi:hypothetical protein